MCLAKGRSPLSHPGSWGFWGCLVNGVCSWGSSSDCALLLWFAFWCCQPELDKYSEWLYMSKAKCASAPLLGGSHPRLAPFFSSRFLSYSLLPFFVTATPFLSPCKQIYSRWGKCYCPSFVIPGIGWRERNCLCKMNNNPFFLNFLSAFQHLAEPDYDKSCENTGSFLIRFPLFFKPGTLPSLATRFSSEILQIAKHQLFQQQKVNVCITPNTGYCFSIETSTGL